MGEEGEPDAGADGGLAIGPGLSLSLMILRFAAPLTVGTPDVRPGSDQRKMPRKAPPLSLTSYTGAVPPMDSASNVMLTRQYVLPPPLQVRPPLNCSALQLPMVTSCAWPLIPLTRSIRPLASQ